MAPGMAAESGSATNDGIADPAAQQQVVEQTGNLVRRLSSLQMLGMAFSILNSWCGVAGVLGLGLPEGGPVSLLYGVIFCTVCTTCIAAALGEMSSTYPSSGGVYHIAFHVSSPKWANFNSWWVGWLNLVAWWIVPGESIFGAYYFMAMLNVAHGTIVKTWHVYITCLVILMVAGLVNTFGNKILGNIFTATMIWSILSLVLFMFITLGLTAPNYASARFVFGSFINLTGWSSNGLVWFIGLLQSAILLVCYDSVMHMSEEMARPTIDVPRAMMLSTILGGVTSFIFLVVIFFCVQDIDSMINSATGMPVTQLIWDATNSRAVAIGLTVLPFSCFVFGPIEAVSSASRMTWAFARDGGMPNSQIWSRVSPTLHVPVECIWLVTSLSALYALILFGSSAGFNALLGSMVVLMQWSYCYPMVVLLWHGRSTMPVGDFHMGKWGTVVYIVGVLYCLFTGVLFMFPVRVPVTKDNMSESSQYSLLSLWNYGKGRSSLPVKIIGWLLRRWVLINTIDYNVVVCTGVVVFGAGYWLTVGQKTFKGPLRKNLEVTKRVKTATIVSVEAAEGGPKEAVTMFAGMENEQEIAI